MKLRRVRIENVRSFLEPAELLIDGDISIVIGPNGGGKTNLLDTTITALRLHLLTSWTPRHTPTAELPDRYQFVANDMLTANLLERHNRGAERKQVIELELEVTEQDVANINVMKATANELADLADRKYIGTAIRGAGNWELAGIGPGKRFTYTILNNALQAPTNPAGQVFKEYLGLFEVANRLRGELGQMTLATPLLSLPVNRGAAGFQSSLSLASYNEYDHKRSSDAATSRSGGSFVTLAIGTIAQRYRLLLEEDSGRAREQFRADPQMTALSSVLEKLGYSWELVTRNALTNEYDIRLSKQGSSFLVGAASSGEKELLTYVFAIYGLNVRDALIIVDEPELHLHPKWQDTLLSLFETLAGETRNQFLLATHSPVFVSPTSIQYVSRVFVHNQQSEIVRLNSVDLPEPKHLFGIVNSQNNESIFFSDKVVLVEGISDRLFFEAVFKKLNVDANTLPSYEIVSVGGKGFFKAYEKILNASRVKYAIIADLDYAFDVGTPALKALFNVNPAAIKTDVIDNPASLDGAALMARIDNAIRDTDLTDLQTLWDYIKSRRRQLRRDLTPAEQLVLDEFILSMRPQNVFILSKGDLETYLPVGYRSKDLDKLIRFVADPTFWDSLSAPARVELTAIAEAISTG